MKLIKKFLLTKVAQTRVMPCFQVVLEEAKIKEAPKLECPSTPAPSVEDIEKRLKVIASPITIHYQQQTIFVLKIDISKQEAENRRKSMEASTLEKLAQEEKKREEVTFAQTFIQRRRKNKILLLSKLKLEIIRHLQRLWLGNCARPKYCKCSIPFLRE